MRVVVTSSCRAGQEIAWTYGGAEFQTTLDGQGRQDFIVDAFAGTSSPLEIKFSDDTLISLPVQALDLDRISKIAVIWRTPVELGLHAFEYAALPGDTGHIAAATPSSLVTAREWIEKSGRGHGFLSTRSTASTRDKLEVYTFLHKDGQAFGLITTAIDVATREERPNCGANAKAEVAFRTVTMSRNRQISREAGAIAAAECGQALPPAARLNTAALPVIRIRN